MESVVGYIFERKHLWIPSLICLLCILRNFMQGDKYTKLNRVDGKVIVITGANTGIGKETALNLANRGGKIYLACRNRKRGEAACLDIIKKTNNFNVFFLQLDLSSFKSIRTFSEEFLQKEKKLDILINNAGVMACPKSLTEDGYELQFGTNHLGHFLLTNLLLEQLKKSAPSRIINLASAAHQFGKLNKDDINYEKTKYSSTSVYCQSKLANILFTRELAERVKNDNILVCSVDPGIVKTELSRHLGLFNTILMLPILSYLVEIIYKTPKSGMQTTLYCALDPDLTENGKYYKDCKVKQPSKEALNNEDAKWLWEISDKLTRLSS